VEPFLGDIVAHFLGTLRVVIVPNHDVPGVVVVILKLDEKARDPAAVCVDTNPFGQWPGQWTGVFAIVLARFI
jgi:hypothetical protein